MTDAALGNAETLMQLDTGDDNAGQATPAVSFVVPVHNCEQFVREAIDSVLAQTLRDFELILIDDGSTDGSPDILAEYAAGEPRVRVLRHETARGSGAARNTGIDVARADLLALGDADDVALPERLERQKAYLDEHPNVDFVASPYAIVDVENTLIGVRRIRCAADELPDRLRRYCHLAANAAMYRTRIVREVGGYRPGFRAAQDYDLLLRLAERFQAGVLDVPAYRYRQVRTGVKYGGGGAMHRYADLAREFAAQRAERGDDDYEEYMRSGRMPAPPGAAGPPDPAAYCQKVARTALDCGAYGAMLKFAWRGVRERPALVLKLMGLVLAAGLRLALQVTGTLDWFEHKFRGR